MQKKIKPKRKQSVEVIVEAHFDDKSVKLLSQETRQIRKKERLEKFAWKFAAKRYEQIQWAEKGTESIFNQSGFKDICFTFKTADKTVNIWGKNIIFGKFDIKAAALKIFSYVYIPAQYLLVRCYLFGYSLQPSIVDLYRGFNLAPIIKTFWEFVSLLPEKTFSLEVILIALTHFLPYALRIIYHGRYIIIYTIALYQLLRYMQYVISTILYNLNVKFDDVYTIMAGAPGTGKSSSAIYECIIAAKRMWKFLKHQYWLYLPFENDIMQAGDKDKIKKWLEIKESYEFWADKPCIKCFASNIPIQAMFSRRMALRLTRDHLYQVKRLPAYTVIFIDENSAMVDVTDSNRDRPLEVADLCRWSRHFGFTIRSTEQDATRVQIDMRRVAGYVRIMLKQRWVCKPIPLLLVYYFLDFVLYLLPANKLSSWIIMFCRDISHCVGFRRYTYRLLGNTEQPGDRSLSRRKRRYAVPAMLNARYDDRTFRDFYKPLGQPIEYDIFPSLQMRPEHKESFLRKKKAELLQEDPELNKLVYDILDNPAAADELSDFLKKYTEASKCIDKMSIQRVGDKVREIHDKYDKILRSDIYDLADKIYFDYKMREVVKKFLQQRQKLESDKEYKVLVSGIANYYDDIKNIVYEALNSTKDAVRKQKVF
ncbi:MAG TPA: hypothetical protein VIL24_02385 [Clostridia bacterium]